MEKLEKIIDYGLPSGEPHRQHKERPLKFRVAMKALVEGESELQATSFAYHDLATARKCYRNILLALYKSREIKSYAICLNHYASQEWELAIFEESVSKVASH